MAGGQRVDWPTCAGNFEHLEMSAPGGGGRRRHVASKLIETRRRNFIVSQSLTTLAVSLLICACMTLEARTDNGAQTFRKIFSGETPNGGDSGADAGQPPALAAQANEPQSSQLGSAPAPEQQARSMTPAPNPSSGQRQPRATTRRRSQQSTATSGSTTASTVASSTSTTQAPQTETEPAVTSTPRPVSSTRSVAAPKVKPDDEAQDEAEAEAEEAERAAAARRRRLRNRKRMNQTNASTSTSSGGQPLPSVTPSTSTTTTTSTTMASTTTAARSSSSRRPSSANRTRSGAETSPTALAKNLSQASLANKHAGHHHKHSNASGHLQADDLEDPKTDGLNEDADEEYDDELPPAAQPVAQRPTPPPPAPPIDLNKIKLIDLDHFNETHAAHQTRHETGSTTSAAPPPPAAGTLAVIAPSERREQSTGTLDARSPGIRGIRGRFTPTPASSTARLFSYSKPTSTTEMPPAPTTLVGPSTAGTQAAGLIVQVMNQTSSGDPIGRLVTLNETAGHLDWSKLVRVMFKSPRDNRTVYTLVMNSSELSQHPISDWSNELPGLLRRDFDKLTDKWAHVFPDLMSDLRAIIASKQPINGSAISLTTTFGPPPPPQSNATSSTTSTTTSTTTTTSAPTTGGSTGAPSSTVASTQPGDQLQPAASNQTSVTSSSNSSTTISTQTVSSTTGGANPSQLWPNFLRSTNSNSSWPSQNQTSANSSVSEQSQAVSVVTSPASTTSDLWNKNAPTSPAPSRPVQNEALIQTNQHREQGLDRWNRAHAATKNKSMSEIIEDIREENLKIEDNVKEQGSSLKHFIIICSISVVIATSMVVALILLLMR